MALRLVIVAVLGLGLFMAAVAPGVVQGAEKDTKLYEMRIYYSPEGKLNDLHARFRDHTMKLFAKHGITNVAYWTPIENKENKLIYVLSYPDKAAREMAWKKFLGDPEWQKAQKESEANGRLVSKIEQYFMTATDYSPEIKITNGGDRVFELRWYTASPGNLDKLNARFRDHTLKLFEKHGMTNVAYWNLVPDQKDNDKTLIYVLAHKNQEAAKASFDKFRQDPDWVAARKASEEKAGGSLTVQDGVKSTFMKPTDYSPLK